MHQPKTLETYNISYIYSWVHISGRTVAYATVVLSCASVVLDDARARANANFIEFNTAGDKLLQNTSKITARAFGARILVT